GLSLVLFNERTCEPTTATASSLLSGNASVVLYTLRNNTRIQLGRIHQMNINHMRSHPSRPDSFYC
ncbi:MAG: hypothetical protein ABW007_01430, partial [Chitinophagaceae bacterium]